MGLIVQTIGHSRHPAPVLLDLLSAHSITAVADVRSMPFSRMNPQFNRSTLVEALDARGIAYVFLGRELGARADDPACYVDGQVQYDRLAQTDAFQQGLDRIVRGAEEHRIAVLCAEKDPLTCHRGILVSRHLVDRGVEVQHIREDGSLEHHEESLHRLLRELKLPEAELFRTRDEIVAEAYALRGSQIAYVQPGEGGDQAIEAVG
jgi:uncharacterized protein (DUF488 family)